MKKPINIDSINRPFVAVFRELCGIATDAAEKRLIRELKAELHAKLPPGVWFRFTRRTSAIYAPPPHRTAYLFFEFDYEAVHFADLYRQLTFDFVTRHFEANNPGGDFDKAGSTAYARVLHDLDVRNDRHTVAPNPVKPCSS